MAIKTSSSRSNCFDEDEVDDDVVKRPENEVAPEMFIIDGRSVKCKKYLGYTLTVE